MEFVITLLHGLSEIKFALLAMPERYFYLPCFLTPVIILGGLMFKDYLKYKSNHETK